MEGRFRFCYSRGFGGASRFVYSVVQLFCFFVDVLEVFRVLQEFGKRVCIGYVFGRLVYCLVIEGIQRNLMEV